MDLKIMFEKMEKNKPHQALVINVAILLFSHNLFSILIIFCPLGKKMLDQFQDLGEQFHHLRTKNGFYFERVNKNGKERKIMDLN